MKISFSLFYTLFFSSMIVTAQNKGETAFRQICAACHTIGKGKLVGPDLAYVHQRHTEEWLIKFVKSSQTVIKSGDKYADSLFKAFNQIPMPDRPDLTDADIKDVLNYIIANSSAGFVSATTTTALPEQAILISDDINKGKDLFIGNTRFVNGGPTCNSCHTVKKFGIITGGALAKDLTDVSSRYNSDGIKAIVSGMPFPAMNQSFKNKPLTEEEISLLAAFLSSGPDKEIVVATSEAGVMFWGGITGVIVLLILFSFFWIKRKQRTVNHSIYERQIKSY